MIPAELYTIKQQEHKIIVHADGHPSEILYGGFDRRETISMFGSLEVSTAIIDQAEEITEDEFNLVSGRVNGRWKLADGTKPQERVILSANPRQCWLKPRFIDNPGPDYNFIKALIRDNKYLNKDYEARLREIYKHHPEIIKALIEGSWDAVEGHNNVIKVSWAKFLMSKLGGGDTTVNKRLVSVDCARGGLCMNQIYGFDGYKQVAHEECGSDEKTYAVAARAFTMCMAIGGNLIVIDANGVGAGVADEAERICKGTIGPDGNQMVRVLRVMSADASSNPEKYYNLRAEIWWEGGEILADQRASAQFDQELMNDLTVVTWQPRGGRILIEDKEIFGKILGRSPDKGDAFIQGIWAVSKAEEVRKFKTETSTSKWVKDRQRQLSGKTGGYEDAEG